MQHLRAIHDTENSKRGGVDEEDDTEAVWIPSAVQPKDLSLIHISEPTRPY